jgi:hypothetical protein
MGVDPLFVEYFQKRYPWVKKAPVTNFPWYELELATWEACKQAYSKKEASMNARDKIIHTTSFTSDDLTEALITKTGNVIITNMATIVKIKHMKTGLGEYFVKENRLFGYPIVIVGYPCFEFGTMLI